MSAESELRRAPVLRYPQMWEPDNAGATVLLFLDLQASRWKGFVEAVGMESWHTPAGPLASEIRLDRKDSLTLLTVS